MRRKPVEQQVVAIMGCASGIGRETALQFAQRGARLVVADNDREGLSSLVEELRRWGKAAIPLVADTADYAQVQEVAEEAVSSFGRLDTWVHVAAVAIYATFVDTTVEEFNRVIAVDLMGQIYGAKAALPHLIRSGGGGLIHVSSIEAKRTLPYHSAYGAAKHGVDGFLEALRVELAHAGIPVSVTQIMPASINTPLFDKAVTKIGVKPKGIPPIYEPSLVAEAILYAAEHPKRDIVVGGAGQGLIFMQRLSPTLLDMIMERAGFVSQRTSEPRSPEAPNDLFGPAGTYNRVEGDFGKQSFRHSAGTWLETHPAIKAGATVAAALGVGALIAERTQRNGNDQVGVDGRVDQR